MTMHCIICNSDDGKCITVTLKGQKTLEYHAKKRNDIQVLNAINDAKEYKGTIHVHSKCRKPFTDKQKIVKESENQRRRSSSSFFEVKSNCLFCPRL